MQGISDAVNPLSVKELISWGAKLVNGPHESTAKHVSTPDQPTEGSLVFLGPKVSYGNLRSISILITPDGSSNLFKDLIGPQTALLETKDFRGMMSKVLGHFDRGISAFPTGIADRAAVSHKAHIGEAVRIAPMAVVQDEASIGDGSWIGPGAVIEFGAKIGKNCRIHSNAVIGHHCELGDNCIVHANSCIGSDGFGFIPKAAAAPEKIPQIGRVIIGDAVEIGANCAIDRGAIADTRIQSGTKIDNLCHIAHNNQIGKNCLIAAGFMMAGSSVIGDHFSCGGDVVITDHVRITNNVTLGGRSAVTKDIETPGAYAGYPLTPMKESLKVLASLRELPRLRKELNELRKMVEVLTNKK